MSPRLSTIGAIGKGTIGLSERALSELSELSELSDYYRTTIGVHCQGTCTLRGFLGRARANRADLFFYCRLGNASYRTHAIRLTHYSLISFNRMNVSAAAPFRHRSQAPPVSFMTPKGQLATQVVCSARLGHPSGVLCEALPVGGGAWPAARCRENSDPIRPPKQNISLSSFGFPACGGRA